jgi:hypothetical protein
MRAMRLRYVIAPEWPKLAWLAVCRRSSREVVCVVGHGVEATDEWFCEGVWAGKYGEGDFDVTDAIFGSGGRLRRDVVVFASAGSTVDRLQSLSTQNEVYVSNSLPCLLSVTNASLVTDADVRHLFASIQWGLDLYVRDVPTTIGPTRLTYFDNLGWDGTQLSPVAKECPSRDFSSFARYRAYLVSSLAALIENAHAPERTNRLGLISTLSTGYDSTTVTVLAREVGCRDALNLARSDRRGDNGEEISEILGLHCHSVDPRGWRFTPEAGVLFLAAGAGSGGDVVFKSAESHLANNVVFTGFHGDKVWDKTTKALGPNLVRGDNSGLDFTEYRLSAGFIHCPVPYLGARQVRDIHALSNAPEMAPWDYGGTSGTYSRPICRRIVEESGVQREMFGLEKRIVWVPLDNEATFLPPELRHDYFRWVARSDGSSLGARFMPWTDRLIDYRGRLVDRLRKSRLIRRLGSPADRALRAGGVDPKLHSRRRALYQYVTHWALARAKEQYPSPL